MKKILALSVLIATSILLIACGGATTTPPGLDNEAPGGTSATTPELDRNVSGEITIITWSGSGTFFENIGNMNLTAADLTNGQDAAMFATARAFNEVFPNVVVNYYGRIGGPHQDYIPWSQYKENFRAEHGHFPDVFVSYNLVDDIERGLVADLTPFINDELSRTFNPALMELMNYYGMQAGIPQFNMPWGVWVNLDLAEANNLDVPRPNWTIEEYTRFVSQAEGRDFFGSMGMPMLFLQTGTTSIRYMLYNHDGTGDFVDLNSDEIRNLLSYFPTWARSNVWQQFGAGDVSYETMDEFWWWGWRFFNRGMLLTHYGDPWFKGGAVHPDPEHAYAVVMNNWDIFPRPATPYLPNTVGVVVDPMAVFNHCAIEVSNGEECSQENLDQIHLGYTFAAFWAGDTRAWEARSSQQWMNEHGTLAYAMNDSFPLVVGPEFDAQMELWFAAGRQRFGDANLMPGFQEVIRIWEEGQIWDVSDKTVPWFHEHEGTRRANMWEFDQFHDADVLGADLNDANWLDMMLSRLPEFNQLANDRFRESHQQLRESLIRFYGFSESDF